ncbi:MBL fold metallo-hydrolase [Caproicibacter sp.]|uniref:MBL fold metallo-hydrolase n=1 Tax=Caproicibacter sp. TaxID=2814884 RepID=UPI00398A0BD3
MYELIQAGERTFYLECPAKIGIFLEDPEHVWLIDSGNDKKAGKKVLKVLDSRGWALSGIINTHSNADHIGGNSLLQKRTGCKIYSTGLENAFTEYPVLEPSFLYGGYPCRQLRSKFLMAEPCKPTGTVEEFLPAGMEFFRLGGHFFDMIGLKTADGVCFLADCLFGETIITKYHLNFIYNVAEYLRTLDRVEQMKAELFVPAHAPAVKDIRPLVQINRDKVHEIAGKITSFCEPPSSFEEILRHIFDFYSLKMTFEQYALVGSTVRSYLSYLQDTEKLQAIFSENRMLYRQTVTN